MGALVMSSGHFAATIPVQGVCAECGLEHLSFSSNAKPITAVKAAIQDIAAAGPQSLWVSDEWMRRQLVGANAPLEAAGRTFNAVIGAMRRQTSDTLNQLNVHRQYHSFGQKGQNYWALGRHPNVEELQHDVKAQVSFQDFLLSNQQLVIEYERARGHASRDNDGVCTIPQWSEFLTTALKRYAQVLYFGSGDLPFAIQCIFVVHLLPTQSPCILCGINHDGYRRARCANHDRRDNITPRYG